VLISQSAVIRVLIYDSWKYILAVYESLHFLRKVAVPVPCLGLMLVWSLMSLQYLFIFSDETNVSATLIENIACRNYDA
jgi:hypothetical protein